MQSEHDEVSGAGKQPGPSIALVDDDPFTLLALQAVLHTVLPEIPVIWSTRDGEEAISNSLAHGTRPTFLLVDMGMDGMPGDHICKRIRERTADIVLLCMTAHSPRRYRDAAARSGAQALLDKSDVATLTRIIRAWTHGETPVQETFDTPQAAYDKLSKPAARVMALSPAEQQVMDLCAAGKTSKAIAEILGKSESTIKTHIRHAIAKLGASNKLEASLIWMREHHHA